MAKKTEKSETTKGKASQRMKQRDKATLGKRQSETSLGEGDEK
jgi:hypothetical protein